MCMECRQNPCHPRCPNASEPPIVLYCDNCGMGIREGDEYHPLGIGNVCECCIEDNHKTAELEG